MNRLYILSSGTPTPTVDRFGTAAVLQLGDEYIMIDCGPAATDKLVKAGLKPTQIDNLFFTHHHSDHNIDLPCFFACRWDQSIGRENPLRIWGPEPTELIVRRLFGPDGAFVHDWLARVGLPTSQVVHKNRGGSLPRPEPELNATDITDGFEMAQANWRVRAVAVSHAEPFLTSLAYRFETDDATVVFAGDTDSFDAVVALAGGGCDVLVTNTWSLQEVMDADGEAPHQTGHLNAADMASRAGAKCLVLTHTGPLICQAESRDKALADIAAVYSGRTVFAEELMTIDVNDGAA